MIRYLWAELVINIHNDLVAQYSGSWGVRDHTLLESALQRPQNGYYGGVIEMAAALWESLAQNHPFIDGNKRTAFACMHVFLMINGYELRVSSDEAYDFIMTLYREDNVSFETLKSWLVEHAQNPSN